MEVNTYETGIKTSHICFEQFSSSWLESIPGLEIVREKIEGTSIDWSTFLSEVDLLFIDSSHVVRQQGDVLYEFLGIIPSLAKGVYVHIHDIFTPRNYLDS